MTDFRLTSWSVEEETEQLDRRWRSNDDLYEDYALQTNVVGKFATGSINHTLLVGVDLERETRVGKLVCLMIRRSYRHFQPS